MNKITKWVLLAVFLGPSLVLAGPLNNAARKGDLAEVKRLLDSKEARIDERDFMGRYFYTALMEAALNNRTEIMRLLLDRGAHINSKDSMGHTALMLAARDGQADAVKLLIDRRAPDDEKNKAGSTAFILAARSGHIEAVKLLLYGGADINEKNKRGDTALGLAGDVLGAAHTRPEIVKAIKEFSIENQVPITDYQDIEILDRGNPGSYKREYDAYGTKEQRKAVIDEKTGIPRPNPASIIDSYLGDE